MLEWLCATRRPAVRRRPETRQLLLPVVRPRSPRRSVATSARRHHDVAGPIRRGTELSEDLLGFLRRGVRCGTRRHSGSASPARAVGGHGRAVVGRAAIGVLVAATASHPPSPSTTVKTRTVRPGGSPSAEASGPGVRSPVTCTMARSSRTAVTARSSSVTVLPLRGPASAHRCPSIMPSRPSCGGRRC